MTSTAKDARASRKRTALGAAQNMCKWASARRRDWESRMRETEVEIEQLSAHLRTLRRHLAVLGSAVDLAAHAEALAAMTSDTDG